MTALRNAVYFRGEQQWRPVVVLAAWAVACVAAMLVVLRRRGASPGVR